MDLTPYRRTYGPFPLERRDRPASPEEFAGIAKRGKDPVGAGGLIWDARSCILLVRHAPGRGWEPGWATPGGLAEPGESPEACFVRETLEETGVAVRIDGLTKVLLYQVVNESRVVPFTFFQFEGKAVGGTSRPGKEIAEVAWFDRFPAAMHFRGDYVEPWMRRRPSL